MRWPLLPILLVVACDAPTDPSVPTATSVASATTTASVTASVTASAVAAPAPKPWLVTTLEASDERFEVWLADAETLKLQMLVTVVDPAATQWKTYAFRDDAEYFYPASAIKTFLAVAALRTLNERAGEEVDSLALIRRCNHGKPGCEPPPEDEDKDDKARDDDKKKHQKLRVGSELRKLLAFSDNDSYNRFWDIVGQREVNEQMAALGFDSVRFHHRMNAPAERSKLTMRTLVLPPGKKGLVFKARNSDYVPPATPAKHLSFGTAYNKGGKLVEEAMNFGEKNNASLHDLQRINLSLLFPERPEAAKLGLPEAQRKLLIDAMTDSFHSDKNAAEHHPLSPGVLEVLDKKQVRYVGKSGRAYGFHLANAYIENTENHRAMFVTVTVYANPNGVLNDDDYGYDDTSRPLLAAVGKALTRALLIDP